VVRGLTEETNEENIGFVVVAVHMRMRKVQLARSHMKLCSHMKVRDLKGSGVAAAQACKQRVNGVQEALCSHMKVARPDSPVFLQQGLARSRRTCSAKCRGWFQAWTLHATWHASLNVSLNAAR